MTTTLTFTVAPPSTDLTAAPSQLAVEVRRIFNFGYAGRDQDHVRAHIQEMAGLAPPPSRIPALFPLPPGQVAAPGTITVAGPDTYAEVEFALVHTGEQWLVTIASDHSDAKVEEFSTPRAKAACPDVVSTNAWWLADVLADWDDCTLLLEAHGPAGSTVVQQGGVAELLSPTTLIEILQERLGREAEAGTVVLSGTIGGLPATGFTSWTATLGSPARADLVLSYSIEALPDEL